MFSEGGADTSLEAIAKAAGVGIGTLYRHFPTRDALIESVYRNETQTPRPGGRAPRGDLASGRGVARLAATVR